MVSAGNRTTDNEKLQGQMLAQFLLVASTCGPETHERSSAQRFAAHRSGLPAMSGTVNRNALLSVLGLFVLHAIVYANVIEMPFWVVTLSTSLLLIYGGSLYSLVYTRFVGDAVRMLEPAGNGPYCLGRIAFGAVFATCWDRIASHADCFA
jgi:hypothetical protein